MAEEEVDYESLGSAAPRQSSLSLVNSIVLSLCLHGSKRKHKKYDNMNPDFTDYCFL